MRDLWKCPVLLPPVCQMSLGRTSFLTFYSVRPPLISEWNCSSSALDTVWSSRPSPWRLTVHWKTAPWPAGCSTSERGTRCVSTVNRQLWTLWAFAVPEMAWTRTGKGGRWVGLFLFLIWRGLSSPLHVLNSWPVCRLSRHDLGSQNSEENFPAGHCGVQGPVTLWDVGSIPETSGWIWRRGFRPSSQMTTKDSALQSSVPKTTSQSILGWWLRICRFLSPTWTRIFGDGF